jgi:hypothetical protein
VYIGPVMAYVLYTDPTFRVLDETLGVSIDDDFAWGGVVGLDVPFGDPVAALAGVRSSLPRQGVS